MMSRSSNVSMSADEHEGFNSPDFNSLEFEGIKNTTELLAREATRQYASIVSIRQNKPTKEIKE